jgi:hypothetical protein
MSSLFGCSSSSPSPKKNYVTDDKLKDLQEEDALLLEGIHEEPMEQGTKSVQTEDGITTEIWTWQEEHGSPFTQSETLIYKNGQLISHTYADPATEFSASRQFHEGKVVQYTEEHKGEALVIYFDPEERIRGRVNYKNKECILYDEGKDPYFESFEKCDEMFNTAP